MALTDLAVRRAASQTKPYRLSDGAGLFLWVTPAGTKSWRTTYKLDRKAHLIVLGTYPDMSLLEARAARLDVRKQVRAGMHPTKERADARRARLDRNEQTVEVMARAWVAYMQKHRWTKSYGHDVELRLVKHVYPVIGRMPISAVTRNHIIELLRKCEGVSGKHTTRQLRQHLRLVFDEWEGRDLIDRNPADKLTRHFPMPRTNRFPAALTIEDARKTLASFEASQRTSSPLRLLHRLLALTAVRPNEARRALWSPAKRNGAGGNYYLAKHEALSRKLACEWANLLLRNASDAWALIGMQRPATSGMKEAA